MASQWLMMALNVQIRNVRTGLRTHLSDIRYGNGLPLMDRNRRQRIFEI